MIFRQQQIKKSLFLRHPKIHHRVHRPPMNPILSRLNPDTLAFLDYDITLRSAQSYQVTSCFLFQQKYTTHFPSPEPALLTRRLSIALHRNTPDLQQTGQCIKPTVSTGCRQTIFRIIVHWKFGSSGVRQNNLCVR